MKPLALSLTAALALGAFATTAFAADSVTQSVTAGTRSASNANLALAAVPYSHSAQTPTGSLALTVDDSTGSGAGWNVTIQSSEFVYSGTLGGTNIPAINFSLTSAAAPVMTAGQAINVTAGNGPEVPTISPVGTLETARKTVQAGIAYGQGTYRRKPDHPCPEQGRHLYRHAHDDHLSGTVNPASTEMRDAGTTASLTSCRYERSGSGWCT